MPDSCLKPDALSVQECGARSATDDHCNVHVQDLFGLRVMSFGDDYQQSAMRLGTPHELAIEYTRHIMAFLLFHPAPRDILMIGLGGGSLAKFIHQEMADTSMTVAEVNPEVVAVARSHFHVPSDDERLRVVIAEGSRYVATHSGSADVLIVDGFDVNGQASSLCNQVFYDDCFAALRPGGVFVANLLICDENADIYLRRIQGSFGDRVLVLPSREDDNLVVFAFENARPMTRMNELFDRAEALNVMYRLAFPVFVDAMTCASTLELAPEAQYVDAKQRNMR